MLKNTPPKNKEIRYVLLIQFFWGGGSISPPITPESSVFQDDTGLGGKEGKTPEGAPRTSFAQLKTFSFKKSPIMWSPITFYIWEIRVLPKTARQKSVNAFAQQCRFLASEAQDNLLGVSSDSLVSLSFLFPALRGRILVGRLPRVNWYSASRNYYILASLPKYPPGRG